MKNRIKIHRMIICLLLCLALSPAKAQKEAASQKEAFPYPALPDTLRSIEQRAAFLSEHYWDNYDFADTLLLKNKEITEQGFVNFIDILARFNETIGQRGIHAFSNKAFALNPSKETFENLIEQYLESPESPMRNDKVYSLILAEMKLSPYFDETEKTRIDFKLDAAKKNLPGTVATNFSFVLNDEEYPQQNKGKVHQLNKGKVHQLNKEKVHQLNKGKVHQLSDYKDEKVILYFYDPECENCHKITAWLNQQHLPSNVKLLQIVADNHLGTIYSLKSMPTIYLLDKGNIVILKECTAEQLVNAVKNQK